MTTECSKELELFHGLPSKIIKFKASSRQIVEISRAKSEIRSSTYLDTRECKYINQSIGKLWIWANSS